jgi:hypothetical protein
MSQQDLQQSIANLKNQMTQLLQDIQQLLAGAGAVLPVAAITSQPVAFVFLQEPPIQTNCLIFPPAPGKPSMMLVEPC